MSSLPSVLRASLLVLLGSTALAPAPAAAENAAQAAVSSMEEGRAPADAVQNRFFLKSNRFEVAPVLGYVPNNPFAKRYVGGVLLGYHLSESFSAEGAILYSPDLGESDLKGLVTTLVAIAHSGDPDVDFQQPVDKMILGATFAARWAPIYGKINILGERVLNFDFYGTAGLGLLSTAEYYATYNKDTIVELSPPQSDYTVPVNLGVGFNFFLNQSIALKLDARSYLYVDKEPDYDPDDDTELGSRLYNTFIASAGVSIFIPKMKPRLFDF